MNAKKRKTTPPLSVEDVGMDVGALDETNNNKKVRGLNAGGGDRLEELEEMLKLAKSGENPVFLEKMRVIEKRKKDDLQKANLMKELRLQEAQLMYDYAVQEANDIFNAAKKEAQEKLILELEESVRRAKEARGDVSKKKNTRGRSGSIGGADDDNSQEGEEAAGGTSQDEQEEGAVNQLAGQKKSTRNAQANDRKKDLANGEISQYFAAPPEAITDDLAKIHADWLKRVEHFHSKDEVANMTARVEDGRLYFNEHIIEKGNHVIMRSEAVGEDIFGTAHKITATEIQVKLADGSIARLPLTHLRAGRSTIKRDLPKDLAMSS